MEWIKTRKRKRVVYNLTGVWKTGTMAPRGVLGRIHQKSLLAYRVMVQNIRQTFRDF